MSAENQFLASILIMVFLIAFSVAVITIILLLHQKKFIFNQKIFKLNSEYQKNLLSTQLEIQEQTFNYISREIHDHVGQRLTLARFYFSKMEGQSEQEISHLVEDASRLIGEAIVDLKQLSRSLTSSVIEDNGLIFALQQEVNRIRRLVSWLIDLDVKGDSRFVSVSNEVIIFRIVQEALQNIMKYASPTKVLVVLNYLPESLQLKIMDDGVGFNPDQSSDASGHSGSGLLNMKNRAAILQGSMEIDSAPGKGTRLEFQFPLNQVYV
jgi:signal transduction histidine kinase